MKNTSDKKSNSHLNMLLRNCALEIILLIDQIQAKQLNLSKIYFFYGQFYST